MLPSDSNAIRSVPASTALCCSGDCDHRAMVLIVNGDIGGTNARMQMWGWNADDEEPCLRVDRRYPSREFTGIEKLVRTFLLDAGLPVDASIYDGEMVDAECFALRMG